MKLLLFAAAAAALTGCVSAEEIERADISRCSSIGAGPGAERYAECRMILMGQHQAEAETRAARMAAVGAALSNAGAAMQTAPTYGTPAGFTKVCTYNTISGQRAITVGSLDFCPLIPPS